MLLGGLALAGCAPERPPLPPPPPAPLLARDVDAIGAELDLVVRVDLARIRASLGPEALAGIAERTLQSRSDDPATRQLLVDALERTDVAHIALRPGKSPELTDNVLVLRGRFDKLEVDRYRSLPGWLPPEDLGADVRVYDRRRQPGRSEPARVYAFSNDRLVFVSAAAIDSAERAIERGVHDERLEPPAKGAISLAARPRALAASLSEGSRAAARFLAKSELLQGYADLTPAGLELEVELRMQDEASARRTADALGLIAEDALANGIVPKAVAESLDIRAVGEVAVLRVAVPLDLLGALLQSGR